MHGDSSRSEVGRGAERRENQRMKSALHVLLEARERLLSQMTEDILAHRDGLLTTSVDDGVFGFELQEIEDRYSARLSALNSILENLDERQPAVQHRVETFDTSLSKVGATLRSALNDAERWDLVDFEVVPREGDKALLVVVFARDEYDERF